jgi:hypothetical protein
MPPFDSADVSAAINSLGAVLQALLEENEALKRQVEGVVRLLRAPQARVRPNGAPKRKPGGGGKRGRPFRFSDEQVTSFRKQVEAGKSASSLAKALKVSLPTMYKSLKRAGWRGRG